MSKQPTIGVFFGSRSPEHDISIITGQLIISGLAGMGYPVVPVYLSKEGDWYVGEKFGSIDFFKQDPLKLSKNDRYTLDMDVSGGKLIFYKRGLLGMQAKIIDIAFPALHGQMGEDGTIQGLFDLLNVPYVGCGVTASAVTMDKVLTKERYRSHSIQTTPYVALTKNDWATDSRAVLRQIGEQLTWPLFVKPARLGSSIGIEKVEDKENLERAVEVALHYDTKALVENAVDSVMDVTCAVLGNEDPRPSLLQESLYADALFSYEEKYLKKGGAQLGKAENSLVIPARLDPGTTETIQGMAVTIYKLFECSGTSRIDFLVNTKTKEVFANEVNTMPGTLYHHLWRASGVSLNELLEELLDLSMERYRARGKLTTTFSSNVLAQAGSGSKTKLQ